MNWNDLRLRLRGLILRSRAETDLNEELQFHLEMETRKLRESGIDVAAAERAARVRFGGAELAKEGCRDARGTRPLEDLVKDLGYGLRILRKDRGYTLTAICALALGIAANTVLFQSFASAVLRPLPVPEPDRLVSLTRTNTQTAGGFFSFSDYLYLREHVNSFDSMTAETPSHLRLVRSPGSPAEPVMGLFVTANYLATFGVRPALGRDFAREDDRRSAPPFPAMISENFWRRRLNADDRILGRSLVLSGVPVTVIGITPKDFMGTRPDVPDVWVIRAAQGDPQSMARDRTALSSVLTARLKPGVTLEQAQAEVASMVEVLRRDYPAAERQWSARVTQAARFGPAHANFIAMYVVLQIAMGLVLLIACSNVAGLLLGRAAARQREIAVRLSLGATRARLVRQLLTEGVLVALLAGATAFFAAWQLLSVLARYAATLTPGEGGSVALDPSPDLKVFAYIFGMSVLAGISFALLPALQSTRPDLAGALKDDGGGFGLGRRSRIRGLMVAGQVAVCLALLIGAGLLSSTSMRMLTFDPGFDTRHVLAVSIASPEELGYSSARAREFDRRMEARLRALPGVVSLSMASRVPLGGNVTATRVEGGDQQFPFTYVSREYFETLGIAVVRGRGFVAADFAGGQPVAVVSESLARRLWPAGGAVGKRVALGSRTEVHFAGRAAPVSDATEIVGIVRDVYSVDYRGPDPGAVYLPMPLDVGLGNVFMRVAGDPGAVASMIAREVRAAEPALPATAETLQLRIANGESLAYRISAMVFAGIGLLGFALASVGVYSMVAYTVSRQSREVGIRMALGAQRRDVIRMVLGGSLRWIAGGLAAGAAIGIALSRLLASQLALGGSAAWDPAVIGVISLGTGLLALVAAYVPARRAARLDPVVTLRFE